METMKTEGTGIFPEEITEKLRYKKRVVNDVNDMIEKARANIKQATDKNGTIGDLLSYNSIFGKRK